MYDDKKTTKITCHLFWKNGKGRTSPPVYAFKCLLPVSSEMKGKVVCNASALSVSHLISCLTHYSDFSGQSSMKAVFLGFCSRLAFSSFPQSVNFTWLISCQLTYQLYVGKVCIQNNTGIKHIFLGEFLMGC